MAKKKDNTLLIVGAVAVGGYLLMTSGGGGGANPVTSLVTTATNALLPASTAVPAASSAPSVSVPASMMGVNSGVRGGNGSYYTCSNYNTLAKADPNLLNPNYTLTAAQQSTYLSNYLDLQQGLPAWIGNVIPGTKTKITNLPMAIQVHWKTNGCAQQRIYYPLQPASGAAYVAPPANPKSSGGGSSWIGSAISAAATIIVAVAGPDDTISQPLNNAEVNLVITSAAVIKNLLPFYLQVNPELVHSINNRVDSLVSHYAF